METVRFGRCHRYLPIGISIFNIYLFVVYIYPHGSIRVIDTA